jgi:hypothetical protein
MLEHIDLALFRTKILKVFESNLLWCTFLNPTSTKTVLTSQVRNNTNFDPSTE